MQDLTIDIDSKTPKKLLLPILQLHAIIMALIYNAKDPRITKQFVLVHTTQFHLRSASDVRKIAKIRQKQIMHAVEHPNAPAHKLVEEAIKLLALLQDNGTI